MFFRIPLLIELARLCLEHDKHDLAADCLENLKGGVKVTMLIKALTIFVLFIVDREIWDESSDSHTEHQHCWLLVPRDRGIFSLVFAIAFAGGGFCPALSPLGLELE